MLVDMRDIFINMLDYTWPVIVISMVIVISFRITDLIIKKTRPVIYNELLNLLFIIYILCLFQVVTIQDVSFGGANIIPFKEIFRYDVGSYLFYKNILGNVLLFLPFGIMACYILKIKRVSTMIILSLISSFSIEITQLYIGRVFDVDDVILNVLGSVIGFYLFKLLEKIFNLLHNKIAKEWVINILMFIFIIIVVRLLV